MENHRLSVSIVIPTLDSSRTLAKCLESVCFQDYPRDKVEIIIVDGGSQDNTLQVASSFGVRKIISNPLRTGEAGKSLGVQNASNEIIAFIDSDNILPSQDWLSKMMEPFCDERIVGSEPMYYTYRRGDPMITRYCSLIGMNDVLCLFLGNYDRYCYLTGKWTGLKVNALDMGMYVLVELDKRNIPTLGANGFLVRAEILRMTDFCPYLFDVDVVHQLIQIGFSRFAKVKVGIVHLFASNTQGYIRKTRRRIFEYYYYQRNGLRRYPWKLASRKGIQQFVLSTLFLPLMMRTTAIGVKRQPDVAWFYHIIASWITLLTYGCAFLFQLSHTRK